MARRLMTKDEWDEMESRAMEEMKKTGAYLWFKSIVEAEENVPKAWDIDTWLKVHHVPNDFDVMQGMHNLRTVYTRKYGFVIVTKQLVWDLKKLLFKDSKVLEVMSGTGYLAMALRQEGVDIIPTDNMTWAGFEGRKRWIDIENIDAVEAVHKYAKDVDFVLMSWPPYSEPIGYHVWLAIQEQVRNLEKNIRLVLIGEGPGGCTGDDDLNDGVYDYTDDELSEICNHHFAQFPGIHDDIAVVDLSKRRVYNDGNQS